MISAQYFQRKSRDGPCQLREMQCSFKPRSLAIFKECAAERRSESAIRLSAKLHARRVNHESRLQFSRPVVMVAYPTGMLPMASHFALDFFPAFAANRPCNARAPKSNHCLAALTTAVRIHFCQVRPAE